MKAATAITVPRKPWLRPETRVLLAKQAANNRGTRDDNTVTTS